MRIAGRGFWVAAALTFMLLVMSSSCSNASDAPTPTVAVTAPIATLSTAQAAPAGDPATTIENVIQACREKDAARLRTFVAGEVLEEDIQALFARGADVRLVGRTPAAIDDGQATVDVRLEINRGGETETVERTWELEQNTDGVWRFAELPDCF